MIGPGGCVISKDGEIVGVEYCGHEGKCYDLFGHGMWEEIDFGGIRISISDSDYIIFIGVNLDQITVKAADAFRSILFDLKKRQEEVSIDFTNLDWSDDNKNMEGDWKYCSRRIFQLMRAPHNRIAA